MKKWQFLICAFAFLVSGLSLQAQMAIYGEIYNASNSKLSIMGNLYHNGTLIDSGEVYLSGSQPQIISGDSSITFNYLQLSNSSVGGVETQLEISIGDQMNFDDGVLIFSSNGKLNFTDNTTSTGASDASYVNGKVWKIGNDDFTFPTGKEGLYAPITISAPANTTDEFRVEYIHQSPDLNYDITQKDTNLSQVYNCEYWELEQTNGSSSVFVELSWDINRSCTIEDIYKLKVSNWQSSKWKNQGSSMLNGDASGGTIRTNSQISEFGPMTVAQETTINTPLPIELVDFWGNCINEQIQIQWISASETNNKEYIIERSADGVSWNSIHSVEGSADSQQQIRYSYTDPFPNSNLQYYRLKQVDFDGKTTVYDPIMLNGCNSKKTSLKVFPNPTNGELYLDYSDTEDKVIEVQLLSIQGTLLRSFGNESYINLQQFDKGTYLLVITTQQKRLTEKIILQ